LEYLKLDQYRFITDLSICNIANSCSKLEHLDIGVSDTFDKSILGTNISKDALIKLDPKIEVEQDSTLDMRPEEELNDLQTSLVYLVQDLWLSYVNLEDIVQYCEDKIKDEHYQKSIVKLKRNMRGTVERLNLMFVPRDIKYRGKELLSSHMKFQTTRSEFHQRLRKNDFSP
ncbi:9108_t:CDS:2, partial [Diversispora eburnea]